MWNVLQRELRELSRQPLLPGLRMLGGGIMIVLLWLAWERAEPGPGTTGRGFFLGLNRILFVGIWLVAPVLTADCLSREKRDGTLGLLMLTPLRPVDVVVGKACSQALRAFVLVLAAMPVMVIPVLLGGVVWMDAVRMLFLQLAALGLALSAGLAASSMTADWWRARLLAFGFAATAGLLFVALHLAVRILPPHLDSFLSGQMPPLVETLAPGHTSSLASEFLFGAQMLLARSGFGQRNGFDEWWRDLPGLPTTGASVAAALGVLAASALLVTAIVHLAALSVQRTWREEPGSARRIAAEQALVGVRFARGRWNRTRARMLDRNPVRWLQSRTWDARVSGWLLAAAATLGWWISSDTDYRVTEAFVMVLRPALIGVVAFMATASFRRELEMGALELWLVTPLSPAMIVRGRITALLSRTAAALAIVILLPYLPTVTQVLNGLELSPGRRQWLIQRMLSDVDFSLWIGATTFLGVALSLSRLSFLTAFGFTWVLHHVPYLLSATVEWILNEIARREARPPFTWDSRGFLHWSGVIGAGTVLVWSWSFARRQLALRRFLAGPDTGTPRLPGHGIPAEVRAP